MTLVSLPDISAQLRISLTAVRKHVKASHIKPISVQKKSLPFVNTLHPNYVSVRLYAQDDLLSVLSGIKTRGHYGVFA